MPAVRIFSLYAAVAVFFDFLLQVTAFVAILSLDYKRQQNNRCDLCCCYKEPKKNNSGNISCNMYVVMKYFAKVLLSDIVRPVVVSRNHLEHGMQSGCYKVQSFLFCKLCGNRFFSFSFGCRLSPSASLDYPPPHSPKIHDGCLADP